MAGRDAVGSYRVVRLNHDSTDVVVVACVHEDVDVELQFEPSPIPTSSQEPILVSQLMQDEGLEY